MPLLNEFKNGFCGEHLFPSFFVGSRNGLYFQPCSLLFARGLILEKRFEFLEHTADFYIAAYGDSLEEAFENAAAAMFEGMTELDKIRPQIEDRVEVEGHDKQALLYNWLEALLLRFETENKLYSRFRIARIEKTSTGTKLRARIKGEPFDPNRHPSKVGVKAVTYHQMEITENRKQGVTVKFILDI